MKEKLKDKIKTREEIIKKINQKKKVLKFVGSVFIFTPILGVSLFQSSYMGINNEAKNIVSNTELEHAKYVFSKKFVVDYYIKHFNEDKYTDQQYQQDLNTYKEYKVALRDFYKDKIATDPKLLSLFPELKNEDNFIHLFFIENSKNVYPFYESFEYFYDQKNTTFRMKSEDYKKMFYAKNYEVIRENYNNGNMSDKQNEFISNKITPTIEFSSNKMILDSFDRGYSPMSEQRSLVETFHYSKDEYKLYGISSLQNNIKYGREIVYNYVSDNINYKNKNIESEEERLNNKFKSDPNMYFGILSSEQQKIYIDMLRKTVEENEKYHTSPSTLELKETKVLNDMVETNINQLKEKDPVVFKNTLRIIRYENDISNIRLKIDEKNNGRNPYRSLNFNTINFLNLSNYFSSFSFMNSDGFFENSTSFGIGYLSDNNYDDALRLKLSGFYNEKDEYFKKHGKYIPDTMFFNILTNYLYSNN